MLRRSLLRATKANRNVSRAFSGGTASSANPPPPPMSTTSSSRARGALGTFRNQLLLTGLSFGLVITASSNYNLRQQLNSSGAADEVPSGSAPLKHKLTDEDLSAVSNEMAHLTCQAVRELQSTSFLGAKGLDKEALERLEARVRGMLPETLERLEKSKADGLGKGSDMDTIAKVGEIVGASLGGDDGDGEKKEKVSPTMI